MATFEIRGLKEVSRAMKSLPDKVAKKVIRQSIRLSLKPVLAACRRNVPVRSGALKKSLKIRATRPRGRGSIRMVVRAAAANASKKGGRNAAFTGDTFYGGMVEYGTSRMAANPFMRRAFDSTSRAARGECVRLIRAGIEREARAIRRGPASPGTGK